MSSPTRTRKPLQPVSGVCRWLVQPIPVRDYFVGVLRINETEYTATIQPGQGVRLTKPDGEQYHIDLTNGSCDCPDHQYRGRQCKHSKAVMAALAVVAAVVTLAVVA